MNFKQILAGLVVTTGLACGDQQPVETASEKKIEKKMFELISSEESGIHFNNVLDFSVPEVNLFKYANVFNGAGAAIGDFNNDGLADVFFTGNMVSNRLYLNQGDMKFKDVTDAAGLNTEGTWSTGVATADVNNDGWLDIYVCRAFHDPYPHFRENLMYINNQDGTFTNKAREMGIADDMYATQATFLDYDKDGDQDLYVANYPREYLMSDLDERIRRWQNPYKEDSDRLYRNDGGTFTDVTEAAGVLNHGFILGLVASDLDGDGWTDIYVANDHAEPDYFYHNNGDGTFTNIVDKAMKHISNFAMGTDLADFNNDGLLDMVCVDMQAEDNYRIKTQMANMAPEQFWKFTRVGFHYQYMRNTLQLNNGNGTFSEIGQMAGIASTDWSWSALLADIDNDGLKDLLVTNGYRKEFRDNDFQLELKDRLERSAEENQAMSYQELNQMMGDTKLNNYVFKNNGDLTFTKKSHEYGFTVPSFSYGAAMGDLDNDGDLDVVINNLADKAFVYRNNATEITDNNYLRVKLQGPEGNVLGSNAKVTVKAGGVHQFQEMSTVRGYQSSMEPVLHFGLGTASNATVEVEWPDGKYQKLESEGNQQIEVRYADATGNAPAKPDIAPLFTDISASSGFDFEHTENEFDDYEVEILLPHQMSRFGPYMATGDVNGDGTDDIFIGGAAGQSGALYVQKGERFSKYGTQPWRKTKQQEDVGSTFFDADGDGDLDLYIVSGGSEFFDNPAALQDRLYTNDGKGNFSEATHQLPSITSSGSVAVPADYDGDGDLDLFVGGRVVPQKYPFPPRNYILRNDGGTFTDVTDNVAASLAEAGMITSAEWVDVNGDDRLDLVVVGEWMPISFFVNEPDGFRNATEDYGTSLTTGWWNKLVATDMDNDGDMDFVAGNYGLNSKFRVSEEEPLHVYAHDFDNSGTIDIVLGYYNQGLCYPVRGRQCSSEQMPNIKKKFGSYDEYGKASLEDVYGDGLEKALGYKARTFASVYVECTGPGQYAVKPLPQRAQISTTFGLLTTDFDNDGTTDILLSGNFYSPEVETGRQDAGIGLLLRGNNNEFDVSTLLQTGFYTPNDVRDMVMINEDSQSPLILVSNNNGKVQVFRWNKGTNLAGQ